jgi:PIN domain nuclease of toxin-antitoxin system
LARTARRLIETEALLISPVLLLELALLEETGRVRARAQTIFTELQESVALSICDLLFAEVSIISLQQKWTRDPFDRLILAQALHGVPDCSRKTGSFAVIIRMRSGSAQSGAVKIRLQYR